MNYKKWLNDNTASLKGKTVAVTGATGGIGTELCRYLVCLGAELLLLNRSEEKTKELINSLQKDYPDFKYRFLKLDLSDKTSVDAVIEEFKIDCPDVIIHNAGAYSIPRKNTNFGVNNIFAINFLAPYYITEQLWDNLSKKSAKIVLVGSIAHNYSKTNPENTDFSNVKADSKVYGNAKRHLMLSFYERFKNEASVTMSVTHPGITFTNITAHYPKLIFAIIKYPMKTIFMKPKKAALCILKGVFEDCGYREWIGPGIFDIWGMPRKTNVRTFNEKEASEVFQNAKNLTKCILDE